jgi:hypothetical protein
MSLQHEQIHPECNAYYISGRDLSLIAAGRFTRHTFSKMMLPPLSVAHITRSPIPMEAMPTVMIGSGHKRSSLARLPGRRVHFSF